MRIVFLSYNYSSDIKSPTEWVERIKFYVGWNEQLAKKHTVIRVDQINYTGDFEYNGVHYYCVDNGRKKNFFPGKLNRFVKNLNPDIVLVSSFLFPLQIIQLRLCLGKNIKIIIQNHAEKPFKGIKKLIQNYASTKVDAFLFTSHSTGADWVKSKNLKSINKIHELLEVSSPFYPMNKNAVIKITNVKGSHVFLWVGRLNANKDPLTAVKAFLKFADSQPEVKFYMIYQTDELYAEIEQLIQKKQGKSPVILIGKIHHDELIYWFNSADFYISASHYEGSGTALCEAMSCGCIPIVSSIPPFKAIAGNCGLFFELGNEESLLSVLKQSIHLDQELSKESALQIFRTQLSFEAISDKFQRIIESL